MTGLLELLVATGGLPPSVLVLRAGATHAMQANPMIYDLQFPASLTSDDVEAFLASLTGLLPPWWKRIIVQPVVSFELVATAGRIRHLLIIPGAVHGYLDSALQAHLPGVRYEPVEQQDDWLPQHAVEYRTTTDARPLRVDPEAVATGLLTAVQPLHRDERVVVQWLLTAAWPTRPARLMKRGEGQLLLSDTELLNNAEAVTARRAKLRAPLLLAAGRIGAQAGNQRRAIQLVHQAEGPFHATRAPGVHLLRRVLPPSLVAERIRNRRVPVTRFPAMLNIEEASGIIGWPIGSQVIPGLSLGGCRLLPVSGSIAKIGTVLGTATFPAQKGRPVAIDLEARFRHVSVTGPTGTGKTTLLTRMALQDLQAGRGVVVIDPKGELVAAIMERLPEKRLNDVIVLDAARGGAVVGYNPLKTTNTNSELVVEQVLGVMRTIWRANWGPRTDALLRACLFSLATVGGMTICEIPALLTDPAFRKRLTSRITDPFGVEAAWAQYDSWSEGEQVAAAAPLLNKVQALTTRPRLRGIFGQLEGAVDFSRIITERQVLLVNLAAGSLGTEAAYLLGALLFAGLWDAVSARGNLAPERRPPVMAMLDEFQHVVQLPTPTETILAEARSYGLGLTIAHQHLGQLDADLKHAVLANARTKVVFQTSVDDASVFARELGGGLTADDLMGIAAYEAVVAAFADGQVQPPGTIRTEALPPKLREADTVRTASQRRWGVARADVDASLVERQHGNRASKFSGRPQSAGAGMSGVPMSDRSSGRVEREDATHLVRDADGPVSSNDVQGVQPASIRVRSAQAEAVIAALTVREQAIVADVGRLRVVTGGQLQRLHFEPSASGQRHGRRVLTSLTERRVLARLGRSIGGVRAGSAGFVYSLDVIGQRLLDPRSDVRRPWLPSTGFVRHAAMVSECYVRLVEAAWGEYLELLDFEAEPACWRSFVNRRGARQTLKPDAFIRVGLGEFEDRWFLECDRATEDLQRIMRKAIVYGHYWQTGKEAVFPRVLWVASRAGRAVAIAKSLETLPETQRRLFAVCEMGDFITTVAGGAGDEGELTNKINERR